MTKTAIIIGAGYGGMALANILGRAGYTVDVFEKNSSAGGRITATKQDGFVFDLGPSWYLMPEVFEQYYQLFGESAEKRLDLIRFTPGYKVFFESHAPVMIQGNVGSDRKVFEQIEVGAGKKFERYIAKSSLAYDIAVKYFLYNNFSRVRDILKFPIIKQSPKMLGLTVRTLDRYVRGQFKDLRLRQLLEYHMVFLGSSPFQAPAIYSLMSHLDYQSGVFYPRGGMLSLVDDIQELGKTYDITYHYDKPVEKILLESDRAIGIKLKDGEQKFADIVISNADIHHTETHMLPEKFQSYPPWYWQKRQPGPGALLVSLGIKGKLPQLLHHNLYFVDDWRGNFADIYEKKRIPRSASIYVCNPTKTDPKLAPRGHENIFILLPIPAGIAMNEKEQGALAKRAVASLAQMTQIPDLAERITTTNIFGPNDFKSRFNAWQFNAFGGESHLLSQSIIFRTANKSKKVKNLFYVGAGTAPGIGLPMCLIGAQLTYKKIIGDKKSGPLSKEQL